MAPSTIANMMRRRCSLGDPIASYSPPPDDFESRRRRGSRPRRSDTLYTAPRRRDEEEENENIIDDEQDQTGARRYHLRKRTTPRGGVEEGKRPRSDDIDPKAKAKAKQEEVDHSVTFESVAGHSHHIQGLKEMVFLPLIYPHFFSSQNITPPRGVLFCGPPGTGKTLMASALASEASMLAGHTVSFYMRKGADLLSKWMGESEKQLTLLFEEAKKNQPSIIFFDEIDGLAPARSAKQEQGHISVVSTLLALMDGLDSRGEVVVIGATNRVDAIDGALRRPGRFDREFYFNLPGREARVEILDIYTRKWKHPPSNELKLELAHRCVGYCGADLKGLCNEAAIRALRHIYPQIYSTTHEKFDIDVESVRVEKHHFVEVMSTITPAAHRGAFVHSRPLSLVVAPCLQRHLDTAMKYISDIFPCGSAIPPVVYRPWLSICGAEGYGPEDLGPAILHELGDKFPVHSLGLASLVSDAKTLEEALVHKFDEARRTTPSILYLPHFQEWWKAANKQLRAVLLTLLQDFPSDLPVLLLVTSSVPPAKVGATTSTILSQCRVYNVLMCDEDISLFFDRLIKAAVEGTTERVSAQLGNVQQQSPAASGTQASAGSQDMKMLDGYITDQIKSLKLRFVPQTKNFSIPQFQRLYAEIMEAVLKIKNITLIFEYLFQFADNEENFPKIIFWVVAMNLVPSILLLLIFEGYNEESDYGYVIIRHQIKHRQVVARALISFLESNELACKETASHHCWLVINMS
ncbi:hypothetical protein ACLB2K_002483 [Fragaria x ananassa]